MFSRSRRSKLIKLIKIILPQLALVVGTLIVIDVACYFFLPNSVVAGFTDYRVKPIRHPTIGGRGYYPRYYFVAHPTRGMDIGPNRRGMHQVDDLNYPVWSNRFGCFDHDWPTVPEGYVYFAGDSFTWGYTPYEEKFATLFEAKTGLPTLKCGVTHTGQAHQFDKFREIVGKIGHYPRRVIVGYYANDFANDFAYPHSTVVDGWQVDSVYLDADFNKVHVARSWIEERIAWTLAYYAPKPQTPFSRFRKMVLRYSISAQLLKTARDSVLHSLYGRHTYGSKALFDIYELEKAYVRKDRFIWENNPYTAANRAALLEWKRHSVEHKYELSLLLIPDKRHWGVSSFYSELRRFLEANDIEYLDLAEIASSLPIKGEDAYWPRNAHFSPAGNRAVAEVLIKRWGGD